MPPHQNTPLNLLIVSFYFWSVSKHDTGCTMLGLNRTSCRDSQNPCGSVWRIFEELIGDHVMVNRARTVFNGIFFNDCVQTFFKRLFLPEIKGLEVSDFLTYGDRSYMNNHPPRPQDLGKSVNLFIWKNFEKFCWSLCVHYYTSDWWGKVCV